MAKYNFQISYAPSRPRSSRRTATAASVTSVAAAPTVDISGKLDKAEFYRYFEEVNIGTAEAPVYATRSKRGLFSDSFLSAMGLNPNTGGGGGGGATALSELSDVQLSGLLTGDELIYDGTHWTNRPQSSIVPDLSEYATRTWVQQQGYATSAALTAHAGDTSLHVTSSERTLWNRTAADFAAIVGADSDQIINKWEEVVAFLDTYTEADTLANLLSNKVDKVTGYGLSKNDFTDALLSKLNGIEAGANRYIHPTGGADAAIDDAAGRVLAGITVNALGHVTSVASKTLAAADIPTLSISKVSGLQDALDGKLDAATFDDLFEKVNIGTTSAPKYAIRAKYGLYADGFLSSLGLNSSGGGGEGGATYDRLDAWSDYTADKAGWVLSAGLGYDLYSRVRSLEGGSALSFTTEGTGNVVTAVKKSGTAVVVTKGLTALTSHQPIYSLNFQAGAFEAKKYTPNTGTQTVNIPTKVSHLSNDSGFITSAALTGYATQSWVKGLGYITASALTPYITSATANATFATKLGVSGNQIGTYVNGKLGNLITVPYATNADTVDTLHSTDLYRHFQIPQDTTVFNFNDYNDNGAYCTAASNIASATLENAPFTATESAGGFALLSLKYSSYNTQIAAQYGSTPRLYVRNRIWSSGLEWGNWRTIAFTDSNVASATKLETVRTLWGQPFDGTTPVSGNMTGVGNLTMAGLLDLTGKAFFKLGDATLKIYQASNVYSNQKETLCLQSSFDSEDGETSSFPSSYPERNVLALQPRGGRVAIGKTTADYPLDVAGQARFSKGLVVPYQLGSWLNMATRDDVIQGVNKNSADSAHTLFRVKDVNGNPIAFGGLGAHVGFYGFLATEVSQGVNSPKWSTRWEVETGELIHGGDFTVNGVIHSTSGIFSDGYMSAKGINTASDVRLKRRIADVALTVRDVAEAPVYRFAWINGGGIDVGSTAQYWGAKVPELTHLLADGIHLGLDYGKAALLSVVAVARSTADHERRIAFLERQLLTQNAI